MHGQTGITGIPRPTDEVAERIERARPEDFCAVRALYWALIESMQDQPTFPHWQKGVYPDDRFLSEAIERKQLFVMRAGERIAAAMVLNRDCPEAYREARWQAEASEDEVLALHILAVHPDFLHRGLARRMVACAVGIAREQGQKAIRLDVVAANVPAETLYLSCGFSYIGTVKLFYTVTGLADFQLFEYLVA